MTIRLQHQCLHPHNAFPSRSRAATIQSEPATKEEIQQSRRGNDLQGKIGPWRRTPAPKSIAILVFTNAIEVIRKFEAVGHARRFAPSRSLGLCIV